MALSDPTSAPVSDAVPGPARFPPPVRVGDTIGIAALSGPVDPDRLAAGAAALERLGYRTVTASNLAARHSLFAGSAEERLEAFYNLTDDPEVKAIAFARGGHGVLPLLPAIDWRRLARYPRSYIGYSDLTPFLLQVVDRLGLVALHGPMVAADLARGLDGIESESFCKALAGAWPQVLPACGCSGEEPIEGPLVGGCLSMLTATLGTPWAPRTSGCLLFVEDVAEPPYRVDRMLTHLRLSGTLNGVRALLYGHLDGLDESRRWCHVLDLPEPHAQGVPSGHQAPNLTLPLGAWARLEPADERLIVGLPSPHRPSR